jgi:hypothetical protein
VKSFVGLELQPDAPELTRHLSKHQTSSSLQASVSRWRREPLPAAVHALLGSLLAGHIEDYSYEPTPGVRPPSAVVPDPAWPHSPDGRWEAKDTGAEVTLLGGDAWVELPRDPIRAAEVAELWLCLRGVTGDHCSVYWRSPGEGFAEDRSLHVPFFPGPHRQVVRFAVAKHPQWRGSIEQLRVDVCNGTVTPGTTADVIWLRRVP